MNTPEVTVVVGTRNRGPLVADTVKSILSSERIDVELIVIDQSDEDTSQHAVEALGADDRLDFRRSDTVGVSLARNIGIRSATSRIVLITDDDVVVEPDWARTFHDAMMAAPDVAVGFCQVHPGPHSADDGFIPAYEFDTDLTIDRLRDKHRIQGIGAGMAVRRDEVLAIGGFDERLGPGGSFHAGEDRDLAARALVLGLSVSRVSAAEVVHHGYRTWAEGKALAHRDWFGIGATYAKYLKLRNVEIAPVLAREVFRDGLLTPLSMLLRLQRPTGLRRLGYFTSGARAGLRTDIDGETLSYGPDSDA